MSASYAMRTLPLGATLASSPSCGHFLDMMVSRFEGIKAREEGRFRL